MDSITRSSPTVAVVEFCIANGFPASVVGRWVWVSFPEKPAPETIAILKEAGFRWAPRRLSWLHPCGVFTGRGRGDPRAKYGEVPVSEMERSVA